MLDEFNCDPKLQLGCTVHLIMPEGCLATTLVSHHRASLINMSAQPAADTTRAPAPTAGGGGGPSQEGASTAAAAGARRLHPRDVFPHEAHRNTITRRTLAKRVYEEVQEDFRRGRNTSLRQLTRHHVHSNLCTCYAMPNGEGQVHFCAFWAFWTEAYLHFDLNLLDFLTIHFDTVFELLDINANYAATPKNYMPYFIEAESWFYIYRKYLTAAIKRKVWINDEGEVDENLYEHLREVFYSQMKRGEMLYNLHPENRHDGQPITKACLYASDRPMTPPSPAVETLDSDSESDSDVISEAESFVPAEDDGIYQAALVDRKRSRSPPQTQPATPPEESDPETEAEPEVELKPVRSGIQRLKDLYDGVEVPKAEPIAKRTRSAWKK